MPEGAAFHPDHAQVIADVFAYLASLYPMAGFKSAVPFEPGEHDFSLGNTGNGSIRLSSRWFAAPARDLKAAALCNSDVPRRAGIEGPMWHGGMLEPWHTLFHEFGHVLMGALQARGDRRIERLLRDGFHRGAVVDPLSAPTGYAVPSMGNEDGGEWFAETFAAAHIGNPDLQANAQVQMMIAFLAQLTEVECVEVEDHAVQEEDS